MKEFYEIASQRLENVEKTEDNTKKIWKIRSNKRVVCLEQLGETGHLKSLYDSDIFSQ